MRDLPIYYSLLNVHKGVLCVRARVCYPALAYASVWFYLPVVLDVRVISIFLVSSSITTLHSINVCVHFFTT